MPFQETEHTASQTYANYDLTKRESVFGGEGDLWDAGAMTDEVLRDPAFKIEFDIDTAPNLGEVLVDEILVEIFYSAPQRQYDPTGRPPWGATPHTAGAIGRDENGTLMHVLVGADGGIKTSIDAGETWVEQESGVAETLWGATYAEDEFIVSGENGVLLSSPDGVTWTREVSGTGAHLFTPIRDVKNRTVLAVGVEGKKSVRAYNSSLWSLRN